MTTLSDLLDRAAATARPDDVLIFLDRREREERVSWAEVRKRARRVADALQAMGVRAGQRVAIMLPTCPGFLDALFGSILAGAVPVPLYPPVRLGRLEEFYDRTAAMLKAAGAAVLVSEPRTMRLLGQVTARHRPPLGVVDVARLTRTPVADGATRVIARLSEDDLALVQFSSGTTGNPKPVSLTHRQIIENVTVFADLVAPRDASHRHGGVCWLPLYHDMGLIGCVFVALERVGALVLMGPEVFLSRPALWLRAISRYRATVSPAPNFAYGYCVDRVKDEELEGCDLSSWRLALNGAEPVSAATMRRFQERFARWGFRAEALTPVYGLSEATLAVTFSSASEPFRARQFSRECLGRGRAVPGTGAEIVSMGRPLPGARVLIRSELGEALPAGQVGHIWIQCPWLMRGYLDGTESPIREGWLHTGDLGFLWEDELYVTGRAKDVLILRGQNHSPQEVERAVDGIPGVRTGCTAAVADVRAEGERLLLFLESREARPELVADCRRAVLGAVGLQPDEVIVLPPGTLPRTSSGKIRRGETLRRWRAGTLEPPKSASAWSLAGEMIRSRLADWRQG